MKKQIKIITAAILAVFALGFTIPQVANAANPESTEISETPTTFTGYSESSSRTTPESRSECRQMLGMVAWDCGTNYQGAWNQDNIKSSIVTIILNITTDLTVLAAYLVLLYVIWGGYRYILSNGDITAVAAGKRTLMQAFLGLGIVMLAHVIFNSIRIGLLSGSSAGTVNVGGTEVTIGNSDAGVLVTSMIQWLIGLAGLVALAFVVIAGITLIGSNGDASKMKKGKETLLYAVMGLIIVGCAEVITAFVSSKLRESDNPTSYVKVIDIKELNEKTIN